MEKHSLICLRKLEGITHLFGAPALDVAERDDRALRGRQGLDRVGDHSPQLARQQARLGQALRGRLAALLTDWARSCITGFSGAELRDEELAARDAVIELTADG